MGIPVAGDLGRSPLEAHIGVKEGEMALPAKLKPCWCDKCDDWREPKPKQWETSKAIVIDYVCSICGEVLLRIPRDITFKPPEPPAG